MTENPAQMQPDPAKATANEFVLRTPSSQQAGKYFIGRFSGGVPGFKEKKKSPWKMYRDTQDQPQHRRGRQQVVPPWALEERPGSVTHRGVPEGGLTGGASYFVFVKDGSDFVAIPLTEWYNFRPTVKYQTLTLEEAEQRMADRRTAAPVVHNRLAGLVTKAEADETREDDDGVVVKSEPEDGDSDEDDNSRSRKPRAGPASGPGKEEPADGQMAEDERPEAEDAGEAEEEPGREDWDHEEERADDDLLMGDDAEEGPQEAPVLKRQAAAAGGGAGGKEEDEDSEDEDRAENALSSQGKELQRILQKTGLSDSDEDAARAGSASEEEDEDVDDDEDLDRMATGMLPAAKPAAAAAGRAASKGRSPSPAPPLAGAAGKRKADAMSATDMPAVVPAAAAPAGGAARGKSPSPIPAAKRGKTGAGAKSRTPTPIPNGAAAAPAEPTAAPLAVAPSAAAAGVAAPRPAAAAAPRPPPGAGATGAAGGAGAGGVSELEVVDTLRAHGAMLTNELTNRFKGRMRTPEQKKAFSAIVKKVAKLEEMPPGSGKKFIVLK